MLSSCVPLISLRFPGPLRGENKEKRFLIKVHWIKKLKKHNITEIPPRGHYVDWKTTQISASNEPSAAPERQNAV